MPSYWASVTIPPDASLEPDDQWKAALRCRVDKEAESMFAEAQKTFDFKIPEVGIPADSRKCIEDEYIQVMGLLQEAANEQYEIELLAERDRRRHAIMIMLPNDTQETVIENDPSLDSSSDDGLVVGGDPASPSADGPANNPREGVQPASVNSVPAVRGDRSGYNPEVEPISLPAASDAQNSMGMQEGASDAPHDQQPRLSGVFDNFGHFKESTLSHSLLDEASITIPSSESLEPDDQWKIALKRRIDKEAESMFAQARKTFNVKTPEVGISADARDAVKEEYIQVMASLQEATKEQYEIELLAERDRRRQARLMIVTTLPVCAQDISIEDSRDLNSSGDDELEVRAHAAICSANSPASAPRERGRPAPICLSPAVRINYSPEAESSSLRSKRRPSDAQNSVDKQEAEASYVLNYQEQIEDSAPPYSVSYNPPTTMPSDEYLEPDEKWKAALKCRIDKEAESMFAQARKTFNVKTPEVGISPDARDAVKDEYIQVMASLQEAANEQYEIELLAERDRRRHLHLSTTIRLLKRAPETTIENGGILNSGRDDEPQVGGDPAGQSVDSSANIRPEGVQLMSTARSAPVASANNNSEADLSSLQSDAWKGVDKPEEACGVPHQRLRPSGVFDDSEHIKESTSLHFPPDEVSTSIPSNESLDPDDQWKIALKCRIDKEAGPMFAQARKTFNVKTPEVGISADAPNCVKDEYIQVMAFLQESANEQYEIELLAERDRRRQVHLTITGTVTQCAQDTAIENGPSLNSNSNDNLELGGQAAVRPLESSVRLTGPSSPTMHADDRHFVGELSSTRSNSRDTHERRHPTERPSISNPEEVGVIITEDLLDDLALVQRQAFILQQVEYQQRAEGILRRKSEELRVRNDSIGNRNLSIFPVNTSSMPVALPQPAPRLLPQCKSNSPTDPSPPAPRPPPSRPPYQLNRGYNAPFTHPLLATPLDNSTNGRHTGPPESLRFLNNRNSSSSQQRSESYDHPRRRRHGQWNRQPAWTRDDDRDRERGAYANPRGSVHPQNPRGSAYPATTSDQSRGAQMPPRGYSRSNNTRPNLPSCQPSHNRKDTPEPRAENKPTISESYPSRHYSSRVQQFTTSDPDHPRKSDRYRPESDEESLNTSFSRSQSGTSEGDDVDKKTGDSDAHARRNMHEHTHQIKGQKRELGGSTFLHAEDDTARMAREKAKEMQRVEFIFRRKQEARKAEAMHRRREQEARKREDEELRKAEEVRAKAEEEVRQKAEEVRIKEEELKRKEEEARILKAQVAKEQALVKLKHEQAERKAAMLKQKEIEMQRKECEVSKREETLKQKEEAHKLHELARRKTQQLNRKEKVVKRKGNEAREKEEPLKLAHMAQQEQAKVQPEAECRSDNIHPNLRSHPPSYTCVDTPTRRVEDEPVSYLLKVQYSPKENNNAPPKAPLTSACTEWKSNTRPPPPDMQPIDPFYSRSQLSNVQPLATSSSERSQRWHPYRRDPASPSGPNIPLQDYTDPSIAGPNFNPIADKLARESDSFLSFISSCSETTTEYGSIYRFRDLSAQSSVRSVTRWR